MSAATVFTIVACSAGVLVRSPGSLKPEPVKAGTHLPEWSTVIIPEGNGKPFATIRHEAGKEENYSGPMTFTLDTKSFHGDRSSARSTGRSPIVLPGKEGTMQGPVDRVLSYFMDAKDERADKRLNGIKETWRRNPIMPVFPPSVHLVETATLPVNVTFEWEIKGAQKDPHKIFIWTEQLLSYSPAALVHGGKVQLQFATYGKFFWQVEDADGVYASVPRTIIVRPPGELASRSQMDKGSGGTFPLLFPQKNTTILACLKKHPVRIPLTFNHQKGDIARYVVETRPTMKGLNGRQLSADPDKAKVESDFAVTTESDFMIRVVPVYTVGKYATLPPDKLEASDFSQVRVRNVCSLATAAASIIPLAETSLPDHGTVLFYE